MSFFGKLWRVAKPIVTLGLPIIIKAIAKKNPKAAPYLQIAEEVISAVLAERPDLYGTPGLYIEVRKRITENALLTQAEKRAALAAAWQQLKSSN